MATTRHAPSALPGKPWGSFGDRTVGGSRGYAGQFDTIGVTGIPRQLWGQFSGRVAAGGSGRVGIPAIPFTRESPIGLPGQLWGSFAGKVSAGFITDIPGKIMFLAGIAPTVLQDTAQVVADIPTAHLQLSAPAPQIAGAGDVQTLIPTFALTLTVGGNPTISQVDYLPQFIPTISINMVAPAPTITQQSDPHQWQDKPVASDVWIKRPTATDPWTKRPKAT